ncbi:MAG: Crp/Fnr family transcriptional regulator [Campylobacterales bacterium]|nr:Crp/Fnr family transcriptional regulator [Campylobacterales bacterium]
MELITNHEANSQILLNELKEHHLITAPASQRRRIVERGSSDFDTQNYFYFIIRGKIKIAQINLEDGKEQTLYMLGSDDMFDVASLLDGKEREALIEVVEESEVLEIPRESVRELLAQEPAFQKLFFPYIAKQLRSMEDLAVDLSLYSVYQRLIHLFLRHLDPNAIKPRLKIINNLSHEEIASMVGSVRKVVNRALQQLKKEGVINLSRKKIELNSIQKLLNKVDFKE